MISCVRQPRSFFSQATVPQLGGSGGFDCHTDIVMAPVETLLVFGHGKANLLLEVMTVITTHTGLLQQNCAFSGRDTINVQ